MGPSGRRMDRWATTCSLARRAEPKVVGRRPIRRLDGPLGYHLFAGAPSGTQSGRPEAYPRPGWTAGLPLLRLRAGAASAPDVSRPAARHASVTPAEIAGRAGRPGFGGYEHGAYSS